MRKLWASVVGLAIASFSLGYTFAMWIMDGEDEVG